MKYFYRLLAFILILHAYSCKKDFLDDVNDKNILVRQDYVVDINTTGEYLSGIYTTLAGSNDFYTRYNFVYPEIIADNIKPVTGSSGETPMSFLYSWNQQVTSVPESQISASSLNADGLSYVLYKIISSCNFVIEKCEQFQNENSAKANLIRGQALAIRAYAHFSLVNVYAQQYNYTSDASHPGVVYVKSSNWTRLPNKRNSVGEVYGFILEDLQQAVNLLPVVNSTTLTISQNAAKALLARVYLSKGDFSSARNFSTAVANSTPIMTTDYPAKLFTLSETEALFQLAPAINALNGYNTSFPSISFKNTFQFQPTNDIVNLLLEDSNDKRKSWVKLSGSAWTINKYPEGIAAGITPITGSYYPTLIRSSEMYLIAAESYAHLNRTDSAIFYLDEIRKRANPLSTPTTLVGNALLEAIYKERRKELSFEGFRMFDLLRWKKPVIRQDVLSPAPKELPYPSDKAIAPIPGLDVSKSGLLQNNGY